MIFRVSLSALHLAFCLFLDYDYADAKLIKADVRSGVKDQDLAPPDDVEAVKYWLSTFIGNEAFKYHHGQAERFLHFLFRVKKKNLSALAAHDVNDYYDFVSDPQPRDEWVSNVPHVARRSTKHWRPFRKTLSYRTVKQLKSSINCSVKWLQEIQYVQPFDVAAQADGPPSNLLQYFTVEQWELLKRYVETLRTGNSSKDVVYHRMRWLLQLVYLGGLNTQEINHTQMRDFSEYDSSNGVVGWRLSLLNAHSCGKSLGVRKRTVFVGPDLLNELQLYRTSLGLPALPAPEEDWYLMVPARAKSSGALFQQPHAGEVFNAIISGFSIYLRCEHQSYFDPAQEIEDATIYWLLRTAGMKMLNNGSDYATVCKFFGVRENSRMLRQFRPTARPGPELEQLALKHGSAWPVRQD